nr:2OG-Fe dioxygenase family protein [Vibrio rumoiensis]
MLPSFESLPRTNHADGHYRLRRYSVVHLMNGKIVPSDKHEFMQTSDINHFQGDVVRRFESIENEVLQSQGLLTLCQLFTQANDLPNGQEIEIHQMRVVSVLDETPVAPEGVHQDGFDHIALIGVARHNIVGGEVMLYNDSHQAPFFRKVLEDGEIAILDDHHFWHNAQPIRAIEHDKNGYMDIMVFTAKEGRNVQN